jgi:hypothetical protein
MTKKIILGIAHAALIIEIVIVCNYQHDVLAPHEPIWPGVIGLSTIALAFLGAVRGLEAIFSKHIRARIVRHPVVHFLWFGFSLAVILLILMSPEHKTRMMEFGFRSPNTALEPTATAPTVSTMI